MSAPSQEWGVLSSPLFLSAEGDCGKTRDLGRRGSCRLALGCRKRWGGAKQVGTHQVPSGMACAEPNQGRNNVWVGPERKDTESESGSEGKRCKLPLPARGELVQQGLSHAPRAACSGHRARWGWGRGWSTPRMIGGWLCGLSGPWILPCHPWDGDRMQWGCPCAMQSLAQSVLHHHTGFPLGTETDPE